jgi:hypothetical protein
MLMKFVESFRVQLASAVILITSEEGLLAFLPPSQSQIAVQMFVVQDSKKTLY